MKIFIKLLKRCRRLLRCINKVVFISDRTPSNFPYPISVHRKEIETQAPSGGGVETFDQFESIEINRARMEHLASLNLPIEGKRVLDVGCGVGHLAQFFVSKGCEVLCVDARKENISSLQTRYPGLNAIVADIEVGSLSKFGKFDTVFCYGLLYHLENPLVALRNMSSVCKELFFLETTVTDHILPIVKIEDESLAFSQASRGLGCRPSPSYIVMALNRIGFKFVYAPRKSPQHRDFQFRWKNDLSHWRNGHPLRCIFVASRVELQNPNLVNLLGKIQR